MKTIKKVGSNSTLVANQILDQNSKETDENLFYILLAAILLDTVDLQPKYEKVTPLDSQTVDRILSILGISHSQAVSFH